MALDGFVISNITYELSNSLSGGRINKIAMPDKDELIFTIKAGKSTQRLLISASPSLPLLYLTQVNKPSPMTAPAFCMLLRKHIGSARILSITQLGLERIVCFHFEHLDELGDVCQKKLYVELMGKYSNIIFTDNDDNIIDSIKRVPAQVSSLREVLPGRKYFLPDELKKADILSVSEEDFSKIIRSSNLSLVKALYQSFAGISPLMASEMITRASLSNQTDILSDIECRHLYHTIHLLIEDIQNGRFIPNIIYRSGEPFEFSSIILESYQGEDFTIKKYDSVSTLLFDFYSAKDNIARIRQKSADLRKVVQNALERAVKKFDLQSKQLKDTKKKDKFKVYGDLLNTYGYALSGGEDKFTCENYYDENKEITIPLDPTLSATDNAKSFYDKYAKLKRTDEALSEEIQKTAQDIEHLNSISISLDIATDEADLAQIKEELIEFGYIRKHHIGKKAKINSKPMHFLSSDGFHIYVGKNNYQNEELTFKVATGNDWWFHAKGVAGSHVIVKSGNKELSDRTFEEAAALAAYYSKARDNEKVEIDYIQKKNIKKVPGAAPGFVIYHTNWSMIVAPANHLQEL